MLIPPHLRHFNYAESAERTARQLHEETHKLDGYMRPYDLSGLVDHSGRIQEIFTHVDKTEGINMDNFPCSPRAVKAARHIIMCRTRHAGINSSDVCEHCGTTFLHYNSCHDNYCPTCTNVDSEAWIMNQSQYLLDVPYSHIIFTVPDTLNQLCRVVTRAFYTYLFQAVEDTLMAFAQDPKWIGGTPGFMCTLHPGGSAGNIHPHIHVLFCTHCLDEEGKLIPPAKKGFLFPAKALAKMFKGKFSSLMIQALNDLEEDPGIKPNWVGTDKELELLGAHEYVKAHKKDLCEMVRLSKQKQWNVEIRETINQGQNVMEYLGRYVHRLSFSDSRIISHEDGKVTFQYKNYRTNNMKAVMTLSDHDFVQRYLNLIPPSGVVRNRFSGFWGNRNRSQRFRWIREVNGMEQPEDISDYDFYDLINKIRENAANRAGSHYHSAPRKDQGSCQQSDCGHHPHCECGHPQANHSETHDSPAAPAELRNEKAAAAYETGEMNNSAGCNHEHTSENSCCESTSEASAQVHDSGDEPSPAADFPVDQMSSSGSTGPNLKPGKYQVVGTHHSRDASICPVCGKKRHRRLFKKKPKKPEDFILIKIASYKMRRRIGTIPLKRRKPVRQ